MDTEHAFSTDAQRWDALQTRAPHAEGAFFYAVKTTGVYCRPTCAARKPNRENVLFFARREEAEAAGFRPCRRCTPDVAAPRDRRLNTVLRACDLIEAADEPPALDVLAEAVGLSASHLHRLFKATIGVTPKAYADALRLRRLKAGLAQDVSVTQAIYDAGFNASSRFYENADRHLGMTPTQYKQGAADVPICYATANSALGWVIIAATPRGICLIEFGPSPEALAKLLRDRLPEADIHEDHAAFADAVAQVTAYIETPQQGLDLPLDVQGTAFQRRVWEALQSIPPGATQTYAEVAEQIGRPKAVRAVAGACAANKIALAVPCHRVVRADGGLGGYRWGVERKEALLRREAGSSNGRVDGRKDEWRKGGNEEVKRDGD